MIRSGPTAAASVATEREILTAIRPLTRFLVTSHVRPEGDSVGSALAMRSLLEALGKDVQVLCQDPMPDRYAFLEDAASWKCMDAGDARPCDALVVLDSPSLARVGSVQQVVGPKTVVFNIDHHISNTSFGTHNLVRPAAAAAGEIVYTLFKTAGVAVDRRAAAAIYISLATDTGSFRYSNTTAASHRLASELIDAGLELGKLNERMLESYGLGRLKLYARLLERVSTTPDGTTAWVWVRQQDFSETGTGPEDVEGFIDFPRYLRGVRVCFLMTEAEGEVQVSFRAKGAWDVNRVAQRFGGGGHAKAAGCTILGTLDQARERILKVIEEMEKS